LCDGDVTPRPAAPTSEIRRLSCVGWVIVLMGAAACLVWIDLIRASRVEYVSGVAGEPADRWQPRLIVPGHDNASYGWLAQTRQMIAGRELRVRHIDYENAPIGRAVYATSPYRWWLGLLAWCDHRVSGRPIGASLEWAAFVADPVLQILILVVSAAFAARHFGGLAAALISIGLAAAFPFGAGFLPGAPSDQGLACACALWSILLLVAGSRALHSGAADADRRARRWFFIAGVTGGVGLWINVGAEAPAIAGAALGGLISAAVARGRPTISGGKVVLSPWRVWAGGGALATLAAYAIEFFPSHLGGWQLRAIHPIFAIAWLGGGEALARTAAWIQGEKGRPALGNIAGWVCAGIGIAVVPIVMWRTHDLGFLAVDLPAMRLTRLAEAASAVNLAAWISADGMSPAVWATLLPLLVIGPAVWLLARGGTGAGQRSSIAIALGPVALALCFAFRQLRWWNEADALLMALVAASVAAPGAVSASSFLRRTWSGFFLMMLLPGAILWVSRADSGTRAPLNESDVFQLIERDLARWLEAHADPDTTVVLAPDNATVALHYYGGLRGLATLGWEDRDGLEAAVRIASASTNEEAKELIDRRGVTHIVIPSWDPYLDVYAQMGMGQLEGTFMSRLHNWRVPPWLRPVAYQLPRIPGFEGQSLTVFEVVEDQEDAVALSRTAEYFVEIGRLDQAAAVAVALRRFPANMGAWVARAQVEVAVGDTEGLAGSLKILMPRLGSGAIRTLPWDRRVALAIVLAQGRRLDLAREQVRRCLVEINQPRLRALPTATLYRLLVLGRAFGFAIPDPKLREASLGLLPDDLRAKL